MIVKGILILLAVVVIIGGVLMQSKEKGVALAIVLVLLSFAGDVLSEVTADMIKPLFFGAESTAEEGERRPDSTSAVQAETVLSPAPQPEPEPAPETPSAPVTEPAGDPEPAPAPETSPEPEAPPAPEPPRRSPERPERRQRPELLLRQPDREGAGGPVPLHRPHQRNLPL